MAILKILEWVDNTKNTLVYKFPIGTDQITMGSKLTVRDSQVAIFVNNGRIADVLQPGMHTLSTSKLPFLTALMSWPFGFKSPFKSDVYFVSTKQFPNQKWGTQNPITMRDPDFGTIRVRGYGSYSFRVDEPATFLKELFGTNSSFKTEDIISQLKSVIITEITESIASNKTGALDLAANLSGFADSAKKDIDVKFRELGLKIAALNIENLSFPEEVEKAIDTNSSLGVLGNKMASGAFMQYQTGNAMRDAAKNEGAGGMGAQLGAGLGMAQAFANSMNNTNNNNAAAAGSAQTGKCPHCKHDVPAGSKFCMFCGKEVKNNFCSQCGAKLIAGAKFCPECGTKA